MHFLLISKLSKMVPLGQNKILFFQCPKLNLVQSKGLSKDVRVFHEDHIDTQEIF